MWQYNYLLFRLGCQRDGAGFQVVDCADYLYFAIFDTRGEDWLQPLQAHHSIFDILHDGVFQGIAGLALALGDGGLDEFDQAIDGAGKRILSVDVLDGSLHGATVGMTEHEDERNVEFGDRVLGAALDGDAGAVDDVAGDADDEEFADADVKQDFRRDARIGAGDDDGLGILSFCEGTEVSGGSARIEDLTLHEALIAGEKYAQGFVGCEGFGL